METKIALHLPSLRLDLIKFLNSAFFKHELTGFLGLELSVEEVLPKPERIETLLHSLEANNIYINMINAIAPIEVSSPSERQKILTNCRLVSNFAQNVGCRLIQVYTLNRFQDTALTHKDRMSIVKDNLINLISITSAYHVKLAFEPVVFSKFNSLWDVLDLIDQVGHENLGVVLDTWHLWANNVDPSELCKIPNNYIAAVHLSDADRPQDKVFEDQQRWRDLGHGDVPVREMVEAIKSTGYSGVYTVECFKDLPSSISDQTTTLKRLYGSALSIVNED